MLDAAFDLLAGVEEAFACAVHELFVCFGDAAVGLIGLMRLEGWKVVFQCCFMITWNAVERGSVDRG